MFGSNYHLFSNNNPQTTIKNLGFKNPQKTLKYIEKIESHFALRPARRARRARVFQRKTPRVPLR